MRLENVNFCECKFISDRMWIYTYYDFCDNRELLRGFYEQLSTNGKTFYMWYVYANIHMNVTYKNAVWDYLNGYETEDHILELKKRYKAM